MPIRSRTMNSEMKLAARPWAIVARQADSAPGTSPFLRPYRPESQPESQLEMAHVADVPDTSSDNCVRLRWKSLMMNGNRNWMPRRLTPTRPQKPNSRATRMNGYERDLAISPLLPSHSTAFPADRGL